MLRLQSGDSGRLPQAGLFEADAGTWKLAATQAVRVWLEKALGDNTVAILS